MGTIKTLVSEAAGWFEAMANSVELEERLGVCSKVRRIDGAWQVVPIRDHRGRFLVEA